jgi:hypothetical protein
MEWALDAGDTIVRKTLHDDFGGGREGGISPSRKSPNVFLFTDPSVGQLHGYFDGWGSDGCFHYSGEGQKGDQIMKSGNRAILEHEAAGRSLRLFRGSGGAVLYLGEFQLAHDSSWYPTDAPESGSPDVIRKVIVFRLVPLGQVIHDSIDDLPPLVPEGVEVVPVESMNTESFAVNPSGEPKEAEKREQQLVIQYRDAMVQKGYVISRTRCRPSGEAKPIFSDLFDETRRHLIEAKGTVTREAVRMVIGQIADYSRFKNPSANAGLFPERPRADLESLLRSQGIYAIWRTEPGGFEDNADGRFC